MAIADIQDYLKLIPALNRSPHHAVWLTYDEPADTLYVNCKKPSYATETELTDEDVIIRYEGKSSSGSPSCTQANGSRRLPKADGHDRAGIQNEKELAIFRA